MERAGRRLPAPSRPQSVPAPARGHGGHRGERWAAGIGRSSLSVSDLVARFQTLQDGDGGVARERQELRRTLQWETLPNTNFALALLDTSKRRSQSLESLLTPLSISTPPPKPPRLWTPPGKDHQAWSGSLHPWNHHRDHQELPAAGLAHKSPWGGSCPPPAPGHSPGLVKHWLGGELLRDSPSSQDRLVPWKSSSGGPDQPPTHSRAHSYEPNRFPSRAR
ncbi:uncharacterized protein LOC103166523 [Ornithorhynchus anatinus]|uniref:uncharacterized protein LOC103166523 n=1 Tax=Ornithorhynchus anatinus TaxID=9258 RepID=UPI0010A7F8AE|nr:uncharacterized protein LOC103166523 [Ornithorhynchus anatinus]